MGILCTNGEGPRLVAGAAPAEPKTRVMVEGGATVSNTVWGDGV